VEGRGVGVEEIGTEDHLERPVAPTRSSRNCVPSPPGMTPSSTSLWAILPRSARTLRRLERNGLVERRILPTSPVGVEYSLAGLGQSFREPFIQLDEWSLAHSDEIVEAQRRYDSRED
jgi:hypothetical protein